MARRGTAIKDLRCRIIRFPLSLARAMTSPIVFILSHPRSAPPRFSVLGRREGKKSVLRNEFRGPPLPASRWRIPHGSESVQTDSRRGPRVEKGTNALDTTQEILRVGATGTG